MRKAVGALAVGALVAWGCGKTDEPTPPTGDGERTAPTPEPTSNTPPSETPPSTDNPPSSTPDPTTPPPSETTPPPTTTPPVSQVGPWPNEPTLDYSQRYSLGDVRAMAVDDGYNIWLLNGDRIGVLRPGDSTPTWTSGVGQAAQGFGSDKLALGSSVMCGGSAGRVYVGYTTYELDNSFIYDPSGAIYPEYTQHDPSLFDPARYDEYKKGDMDVVKLQADGTIALEEHLGRASRNNGANFMGVRNTNDYHFDEDRSILSCTKVMRGTYKGEVYIGTNHGVTRIKGLSFTSHRHPIWYQTNPDGSQTQKAGYTYGLGISQSGDVLIANDWEIGIVTPSVNLADWDRVDDSLNKVKLNSFLPELNSQEEFDYWRGIQQTTDGHYFLASRDYGLWQLSIARVSEAHGTKVPGLPTDKLTALAASDDGSLFVGTQGFGLWRLDGTRQLSHVDGIDGTTVLQLFYDPSVQPAMLYVLTDQGLTVLRGY